MEWTRYENGLPVFASRQKLTELSSSANHSFVIVDLDRDGYLDIFTINYGFNIVELDRDGFLDRITINSGGFMVRK